MLANTDWYLFNYRLPLAISLREKGHDVIMVSPPGEYVPHIQRNNFHWQSIHLSRRGINPLVEFKTIIQLARLYRREKPDVVHHFTIKCVLYGSFAAHRSGIENIINAVTGLGYIFSTQNILTKIARVIVKWFYRKLLKGTRVIFQNQRDLDFFVTGNLASEDQCLLIPGSGVDTEKFHPSPIPDGKAKIVLPARMLWDKGIKEFVEAAKFVRDAGIYARFILVGSVDAGNPSSIPVAQLQAWQNQGLVEWVGWQKDMVSIYQSATIVCLPSYSEGLAKSLIEAAACGRPIIATDIPGCREVVRQGINGVLVPPHDTHALARACIDLLSNSNELINMGNEGRKIAVREFSIEKINSQTITVYNQLRRQKKDK